MKDYINKEKITLNQALLIAQYILRNQDFYESFRQIAETVPKNNSKYPDKRADYSIYILADRIRERGMLKTEADYWIKAYILGKSKYKIKYAHNLLSKLNLLNI